MENFKLRIPLENNYSSYCDAVVFRMLENGYRGSFNVFELVIFTDGIVQYLTISNIDYYHKSKNKEITLKEFCNKYKRKKK